MPSSPEPSPSHNNHNLLFLGLGATLFALITTSISLYLYHSSGDIYLDRSRPGFLPDEEEEKDNEKKKSEQYKFSDTGAISKDTLDEYIKELKNTASSLKELESPFSDAPLSNESLGIPSAPASEESEV